MNTSTVLPFRPADRSTINNFQTSQTQTVLLEKPKPARRRRYVLIVEFRDEVFVGVKPMLEELDWEVKRVLFAGSVVRQAQKLKPDLILINEHTQEGSGWLISCKLLLAGCFQPIWIYTSKNQHSRNEWKDYCGVDAVILYGGILRELIDNLRQQLADSEKTYSITEKCGYNRRAVGRRKRWTKRA